ncbi:MAG TPA: O-antigen ligase family protein [Sphingomicrobium sp.]
MAIAASQKPVVSRSAQAILPAFLLLCLLAGGSSRATWGNLALQALAPLVIAFAIATGATVDQNRNSKALLWLLGAWLVLILLQLVPLPPAIWSGLPGREVVAEGYRALGYALPWLPLAMAPYELLRSLGALLVPAAVLLMMLRVRQNEVWIGVVIVIGALAGVTLGALQVGGGGPGQSPWYLYEITNVGAVGFFANSNHMGSLLLAAFPFAVALVARTQMSRSGKGFAAPMAILGAAGCLLIAVGVALNRSLAALALFVPVVFASILLLRQGSKHKRWIAPLSIVAAIVCLAILTGAGLRAELSGGDTSSFVTRTEMWSRTASLVADSFPFGTGVGSFPSVYVLTEDPRAIGLTYINHAHNDFLELILETGLAGLLLLCASLVWWLMTAFKVWLSPSSGQFSRAATIASGALILHGLVDYPMRTGALSAVMAACLGMMAIAQSQSRQEWSRFRTARHIKIA